MPLHAPKCPSGPFAGPPDVAAKSSSAFDPLGDATCTFHTVIKLSFWYEEMFFELDDQM